jgi:hypothetical protein
LVFQIEWIGKVTFEQRTDQSEGDKHGQMQSKSTLDKIKKSTKAGIYLGYYQKSKGGQ